MRAYRGASRNPMQTTSKYIPGRILKTGDGFTITEWNETGNVIPVKACCLQKKTYQRDILLGNLTPTSKTFSISLPDKLDQNRGDEPDNYAILDEYVLEPGTSVPYGVGAQHYGVSLNPVRYDQNHIAYSSSAVNYPLSTLAYMSGTIYDDAKTPGKLNFITTTDSTDPQCEFKNESIFQVTVSVVKYDDPSYPVDSRVSRSVKRGKYATDYGARVVDERVIAPGGVWHFTPVPSTLRIQVFSRNSNINPQTGSIIRESFVNPNSNVSLGIMDASQGTVLVALNENVGEGTVLALRKLEEVTFVSDSIVMGQPT